MRPNGAWLSEAHAHAAFTVPKPELAAACLLANARPALTRLTEFSMLRMPWSVQFTARIYLASALPHLLAPSAHVQLGSTFRVTSGSKQLLRPFEMMDGVRLGGNQVSNSNDSAQLAYRVLGCFAV